MQTHKQEWHRKSGGTEMRSIEHAGVNAAGGCHCFSCLGAKMPATAGANASGLSRRRVLGGALAGIAGGLLAGAALDLALPRAARAASDMTPAQALDAMMAGNQRFIEGHLDSFNEDLDILKQKTADKQVPFGAVLSCADSRVPVELVFDQSIGHLFVTRVAGNVATAEMIASLEYGVAVLGAKAIMVLGHSSCGAVSASIAAKEVPGQISALYSYIRPAVDQAGSDVDAVGRANVKIQTALLREASPVLAGFIEQKQLEIVAGFYDLASGKVDMLS
jgi:carbonic anhydrase